MNNWIKWCECQRFILTTGQMEKNEPCQLCQNEAHAEGLKNRVMEAQKEEE